MTGTDLFTQIGDQVCLPLCIMALVLTVLVLVRELGK